MAVKTRSLTIKFDMKNPGQKALYEGFAEVAKKTQTPLERLFRAAAVRGSAETFEKAREKYQRVMDAGDAFDNFEGLNNPATEEEASGSTTEGESGTEPQGVGDPAPDPDEGESSEGGSESGEAVATTESPETESSEGSDPAESETDAAGVRAPQWRSLAFASPCKGCKRRLAKGEEGLPKRGLGAIGRCCEDKVDDFLAGKLEAA